MLRVSVVRLPRISNFTDIDALAAEPGVLVRFARAAAELADADLVVLPGTRATVADLAWLREHGMAEMIAARAAKGRPVLGICGGYQMLGREIDDEVESGAGRVAGLGVLPVRVTFGARKRLGRPAGSCLRRGRRRIRDPSRDRRPGPRRRAVPGRLPDRGRSGGRAGTGRWRTTRSGGRS